jgi:recombinational DNA repair protein RecR
VTRRLQVCRRCHGRTRHADCRCSRCRKGGPVVMFVRDIADIHAPTVAELAAGVPVGHMVERVDLRGRGA